MVLIWVIWALASCKPTRRLGEGEFLLMKNKVEFKGDFSKEEKKEFKAVLDKDSFESILKQKPNYRILGVFKFHLSVYNSVDTVKMKRDIEKRKVKLAQKNEKRKAKEKKLKKYHKPYRQWLYEDIGEAPVIFDTSLTQRSVNEIQNYLFNHGFFNPELAYTAKIVKSDTSKKKIRTTYFIEPGEPHRINHIQFSVINNDVLQVINDDFKRNDSIVQIGNRIDMDQLQKYQNRISLVLKSHGYFEFNKGLIHFDVDTNFANYSALLYVYIDKTHRGISSQDSIADNTFTKFYVKDITFNTSFPPYKSKSGEPLPYDSISYRGINVLYQHKLNFTPRLLHRKLMFSNDSLYNSGYSNLTYRKLYSLGVFDIVNISYEQDLTGDTLDGTLPLHATIDLKPTKNQGISLEGSATNNGGNLGLQGTVVYTHRNIFKGAEHLVLSLSGGIESQWAIGTEEEQTALFNTVEFSPNIELIVPKFLIPISDVRFKKIQNPRTFFSFDFRYQRRPDYTGIINSGYFGYRWSSLNRISHRFNVVQLSQVNIDRSPAFEDYLESLNNAVIEAIYTDHFIPSSKYILSYNNQTKKNQQNVNFIQFTFQEAGNVTHLVANAVNAPTNENGQYEIGGVPFAQFLKTEIDFRNYNYINLKNTVAYRIDVGTAVPYGNLKVIPFNESFFVGGSNSNRGWRARTLGPGSYFDSTGVESYDKVGDIKLDLSLEYRFNLVSFFDLAFFVDAGNVWFLPRDGITKDNPAVFNVDRFASEIAFAFGTGLRLNFSFFLLRFDFGLQVKDPKAPVGERWIFQSKDNYNQKIDDINQYKTENPEIYPEPVYLPYYKPNIIFNLAIGYPF